MDATVLQSYGIDCKSGIARCLDDESFYKRLLTLFLQDDSFARAKAAFERGDQTALFKCMHELKGVSGNASLTALHAACCELVELLRAGDADSERIAALFPPVEEAYLRAWEGAVLAVE